MTRKDLLKNLIKLGLKERQAGNAVDSFFNSITVALRGGKKVSIVGFGTWEWRKRPARQARNPRNGKDIALAAHKVLFFKPSPLLKQKIRND